MNTLLFYIDTKYKLVKAIFNQFASKTFVTCITKVAPNIFRYEKNQFSNEISDKTKLCISDESSFMVSEKSSGKSNPDK